MLIPHRIWKSQKRHKSKPKKNSNFIKLPKFLLDKTNQKSLMYGLLEYWLILFSTKCSTMKSLLTFSQKKVLSFLNVENYKFLNQNARDIGDVVEQMIVKDKSKRISMI